MKHEKLFGMETLEWTVYHREEAVSSLPSGHNQHNLGDKLSSVYKYTSVKQYLDRARIAAHEGN